MSNKIKDEALLLNLVGLFDPSNIGATPNQPIVDANNRPNESLISQIAVEIQQKINTLSSEIQVFENEAQLIRLIMSTGGNQKTLYRLLHDTFLHSESFPVSPRAIGKARANLKYTLTNSIGASKLPLLVDVYNEPCQEYFELPDYSDLPLWSILRYENAGTVWYRVHPLLVETADFKRAIEVVVE